MLRTKLLFLLVGVLLIPEPTLSCSVFNLTLGGETRVGRNLDWIESSWGWVRFLPATTDDYGAMIFGIEEHIWPQGGMNDQGLVLGMTATPYLAIEPAPGKLPMGLDFWELLFSQCADVAEVLAFLDLYDLGSVPGYFEQGQMLWTDRYGNSAIVEGDLIIPRSGDFQVITNFLQSHPELGGWPCARFDLIVNRLTGQVTLDDEYLISVLEEAHGTIWGGYTVYSLYYDPQALRVTIFNRGDFTQRITLDLEQELAAGTLEYDLDALFAWPPTIFSDGFESGDVSAWGPAPIRVSRSSDPEARRILGRHSFCRGALACEPGP